MPSWAPAAKKWLSLHAGNRLPGPWATSMGCIIHTVSGAPPGTSAYEHWVGGGRLREIVKADPSLIASEAPFLGTPSALCSLPRSPPMLRADQLIESPVYQMLRGTQDRDDGQGLHCASVTYELDDPGKTLNKL